MGVLHLPRDAVALGHVLRRYAHVDVGHRAPESVFDHGIDQHPVAHAISATGLRNEIRGEAHALHAAGHDHLGIAQSHGLRGQVHRFQTGPADLVDGQRRGLGRQSGEQRGLTGGVLPESRLQHVAHDDFVDVGTWDTGPAEGLSHDHGTESGSGNA
jgi:hypothetical protein